MPNIATHPPRSEGKKVKPKVPIEYENGMIPFTTLEIAHSWDRDRLQPIHYQASFLKFQPVPLDKAAQLANTIREEVKPKKGKDGKDEPLTIDNLKRLRDLYGEMVDGRGRRDVPTVLLQQLMATIDKTFARLTRKAIKDNNKDDLRALVEFADNDSLVRHMIKKSNKLEEIKAKLPEVEAGHAAKVRDQMDEGGGRRLSTQKRASNAILLSSLQREKLQNWNHITFNPETGRLNLATELLFEKSASLYSSSKPTAEWQNPSLAKEVLGEVARVYQMFKVTFDVVQVHKAPTKDKIEGADHEEWLILLAKSRAKKLKEELASLGVPKEAMSAKVEKVDGSAIMQYCQFQVKWQYVNFDATAMRITSKSEIAWQKRLYSYDQKDAPVADFQDKNAVKAVCKEVVAIASYYNCDVEVIIHGVLNRKAMDDEHQEWIDRLFDSRAEKLKDELVDNGLDDSKAESSVLDEKEHAELGTCQTTCVGCHFKLHLDDDADGVHTTASEQEADESANERVEVAGAGQFEFNGLFKPSGVNNGKPKYRHESGSKATITFHEDGFWYMCYNHTPKNSFYKSRDLAGPEPYKYTTTDNSGMIPIVKIISAPKRSSLKAGGQSSALSKSLSFARSGSRNSVTFNLDTSGA